MPGILRTRVVAIVLALGAIVGAWRVAKLALGFNDELAVPDPAIGRFPSAVVDSRTPRLSQRVVLVIVDGLRVDHSHHPGFDAVRKGALAAGALGCTISGAGPTMFAWALEADAENVRRAMVAAFQAAGKQVDDWIVRITTSGAHVVET